MKRKYNNVFFETKLNENKDSGKRRNSTKDSGAQKKSDLHKVINSCIVTRQCGCDPYSSFVRAGPFVLGAPLDETTQFSNIDHFLARKIGDTNTNRHYLLKTIVLTRKIVEETYAQRQAKLLIFNEYSVLSMLKNHPNIIKIEGLYLDYFYNQNVSKSQPDDGVENVEKCESCLRFVGSHSPLHTTVLTGDRCESSEHVSNKVENDRVDCPADLEHHYFDCGYLNKTGTFMRRVILALDCHLPHMYRSVSSNLIFFNSFNKYPRNNCEYENLQEYVKRYKNVPELKALKILNQIVDVIHNLHRQNIAHRDLRLENILYNHRNEKVLLVNFSLARYVINDSTCINDHRGSSAYISPDVLKRRPYNPKASDCWALGIIFYTMLFGKFPFYAENFSELFRKINNGQFTVPSNAIILKEYHDPSMKKIESNKIVISEPTMELIRSLIVTDSTKRLNINEFRREIKNILQCKFQSQHQFEMLNLVKQGKCNNDELQVVPNILQESSSSNSKLAKQSSLINQNKTTSSPLVNHPLQRFSKNSDLNNMFINLDISSAENNSKHCKDSTMTFQNIIGSTSETSSNIRLNRSFCQNTLDQSSEDLHHTDLNHRNFFQKDLPFVSSYSNGNSKLNALPIYSGFNAYLSSPKFLSSPSRFPIPYFHLHNRFYYNNDSLHQKKFTMQQSLLSDELFLDGGLTLFQKSLEKSLEKSNKKLNRSLLVKVESDIRPLNEYETNLINQLQFSISEN